MGGVSPSSEHGVGVRVEQCVPGVNGIEVCVGVHGSKFNDAVVALVKAGGFGINDRKDRSHGMRGVERLRRFSKKPMASSQEAHTDMPA